MRKWYLQLIVALFSLATYSQKPMITVSPWSDARVSFGINKILEAAKQHPSQRLLSVNFFIDSARAVSTTQNNHWDAPKNLSEQCYSIRITDSKQGRKIYILSGETIGAMYGALDVAEAIDCNRLDQLPEGDHAPYIKNRGIKFNIPLDLRTPSYSDPGDAFQENIQDVWDTTFWRSYFDEMAVHRYNVMTIWSLQLFPSMVKVPEFPKASLNDVWRTKEKYDDSYSSMGLEFDRSYLFKNVEVVRKMTIDEKIAFWRKVMQMAFDRGISFYIFTWNIFTYGIGGNYGITRRQDNDTTIAYFRAAVREMIKTYPLLRGIGITAGEGMENKRTDEYANEKWLWKTYGEGIRDGLKDQPARKFTLIHRFHWASMSEIQEAFKDLPCTLELSLKYAIAHMYAIPNPPFILPAMPLLSPQRQSWLTIRNDDIYSLRWANNDFARSFIKAIPEPAKIAGYYMGPDGYCWGRDYLSKLRTSFKPPLVMQKQWYSFMLWGRLGYDPDLPDPVFLQHLPEHFRAVNTDELMKGWSASSLIFPWITRFVWGDIDLKWFPEANLSHPRHKGFYTVRDYIEREPMDGSNIEGILPWVTHTLKGIKSEKLTPIDVADTLERLSNIAFSIFEKLPKPVHTSADELNQTLSDIQEFAFIGKYYSEKIRAACDLALLDTTRNEQYRTTAIQHLKQAQQYWIQYANIYRDRNKPSLYHRVGFVDVQKLKKNVQEDIELAMNWKPGTNNLNMNQKTEVPFKQ